MKIKKIITSVVVMLLLALWVTFSIVFFFTVISELTQWNLNITADFIVALYIWTLIGLTFISFDN